MPLNFNHIRGGILSLILPLILVFFLLAETARADDEDKDYEAILLFGEVLDKIKQNYIDEVTDKELIEAAIDGMLRSLDPHSGYLDGASLRGIEDSTHGEFGGLGIEITGDDESGYILIISPIDGTPAESAGLLTGDLIIAIDGESVLNLSLDEAVKLMRGKPGTEVTLEIFRSDDSFEVTIERAVINIESVRWEMKPHRIGYIRITGFSEKTTPGLRTAVEALQSHELGSPLGYVLDLRNNPGGLLTQAVSVSDSFLKHGEIVSTLGRDKIPQNRHQARRGDIIAGAPLLVLINGGSASASEIVAGALQDHNRALIVGSRSFGKGSVQTLLPLSRGDGVLKLTTQRYHTPSGESIQARGIIPDIEILPARVVSLDLGFGLSEADLPHALDNESLGDDLDLPEASDDIADEADDTDYVLGRALEIMRALTLYDAGR